MATAPKIAIRAVRTLSGYSIPRMDFPEAAAQTFKKGAPLVLTVGYLNECGADPALIIGFATRDGQDGTAAGDKTQTVELASPDTVFEGNIGDGSDAAVTAATDRGKAYGIAKRSADGKWYVDNSDTSNKRVMVLDLADHDATGDIMGRVYFMVDPKYMQMNYTT